MNLSTPNNNDTIPWQKSERFYFKLDKEKNNMIDYIDLQKKSSINISRTSDQISKSSKEISPNKSTKSQQDDHNKPTTSNEIHPDVEKAYKNLEIDWNKMYSKKESNPIRFPTELEHHLDSIASTYYKHHAQQRNILSILCSRLSQLTGFSTSTLTKKLQKKKPKDELTIVTDKFNALLADVTKIVKVFVEDSQKELALKNSMTNDIIGSSTNSPQTGKKDTISSKYIWNNDIKSKIAELNELLVKMYELRTEKSQQLPTPLAHEKRNLNEKLASLWPEGWMTKEKIASMIYSRKKKEKDEKIKLEQKQQSSPQNAKPSSKQQTSPTQSVKNIQQQQTPPQNVKTSQQQQQMASPHNIKQIEPKSPQLNFQSTPQQTSSPSVNQIHPQPSFSAIIQPQLPQSPPLQFHQLPLAFPPPFQLHHFQSQQQQQQQQQPQPQQQQQQNENVIKFHQYNQPNP